jgi:ferredoxin, 2Fe-2S
MKIVVTLPNETSREVEGRPGFSLMRALRDGGVPVRAECGGAMACATCHVVVDDSWRTKTGLAGDEESDLLDMSDSRDARSRLSCQIKLTDALDGLQVTLQLDAFEG